MWDYGNNVSNYKLSISLDNPMLNAEVSSEIRLLVWDAFVAHDISLPFPEMELHLPKHPTPELEWLTQQNPVGRFYRPAGTTP